jgi:effector-binding domain-containing protein
MTTTTAFAPEIATLDEQRVALIRVTTAMDGIPQAMGTAFHEIEMAMKEAGGEIVAGPPFARYLSFGREITFETGCPIRRAFPTSGRIELGRLPAGEVATVIHVGPYERLSATYDALNGWVAAQGRSPAGPMWEVYLTDPDTEPDKEKWLTKVFIPIR